MPSSMENTSTAQCLRRSLKNLCLLFSNHWFSRWTTSKQFFCVIRLKPSVSWSHFGSELTAGPTFYGNTTHKPFTFLLAYTWKQGWQTSTKAPSPTKTVFVFSRNQPTQGKSTINNEKQLCAAAPFITDVGDSLLSDRWLLSTDWL